MNDEHPTGAWIDEGGLRWYSIGSPPRDYISVTSMRKILGLPQPLAAWITSQAIDVALDHEEVVQANREAEAKELERRIH